MHWELNSFTNMVAKTDVDAPQNLRTNKKQMKLKIGKKVRTASLNLKFPRSYKKRVSFCILSPIVGNSANNLHILSFSRQQTN